jgi:hypothetical protein
VEDVERQARRAVLPDVRALRRLDPAAAAEADAQTAAIESALAEMRRICRRNKTFVDLVWTRGG